MIKLTRLRHDEPFFVNPDLIERVDTHVDTVVRLTSGTEFVVSQTGEEIVRLIADFRARVIALAGIFQDAASATSTDDAMRADASRNDPRPTTPIGELGRSADPIDDVDQDHHVDQDVDVQDVDQDHDVDVDIQQPHAPSGALNHEGVPS